MESLWPSEEEYIDSIKDAIKDHRNNMIFFENNKMPDHRNIELQYIKNLEKLLK